MIARVHKSGNEIVADKGEQIYKEQFQATYENAYSGQYVVIDILTKKAYVATSSEDAVHLANAEAPNGLFHLMRIEIPRRLQVLC